MAEWIPDGIYRQICDEMLMDPLPHDPTPMGMVTYAGHSDWFVAGLMPRVDGWCEDRDPRADWELTDIDGRE